MHNNRLITLALLFVSALTLSAQSNVRLAVGTYTDGGSRGIYTYSFNQQTGKATLLDSLQTDNPSPSHPTAASSTASTSRARLRVPSAPSATI